MSADWVTTSTLLTRLTDFDDDAWARFDERFRRPVVAFARRQGLPDAEAEDVAQETLLAFAQAHREGRYDREAGRLSRWLFGIAFRQVLSARTRRARDGERWNAEDAGRLDEVAEPEASGDWDREWEREMLARCLERVREETAPATFRAFELVAREHRSPTEAAEELGVPVKSVYNAKHRVLQRVRELRARLEDFEPGSPPS